MTLSPESRGEKKGKIELRGTVSGNCAPKKGARVSKGGALESGRVCAVDLEGLKPASGDEKTPHKTSGATKRSVELSKSRGHGSGFWEPEEPQRYATIPDGRGSEPMKITRRTDQSEEVRGLSGAPGQEEDELLGA